MGVRDMERREARAYAIRRGMEIMRVKAPQLAALIDRDANTVRRWAEGKTEPSADDWVRLSEAFGVAVGDLLTPPPIPSYPLDGAFRRAGQEALRLGRQRVQDGKAPRTRLLRPRSQHARTDRPRP